MKPLVDAASAGSAAVASEARSCLRRCDACTQHAGREDAHTRTEHQHAMSWWLWVGVRPCPVAAKTTQLERVDDDDNGPRPCPGASSCPRHRGPALARSTSSQAPMECWPTLHWHRLHYQRQQQHQKVCLHRLQQLHPRQWLSRGCCATRPEWRRLLSRRSAPCPRASRPPGGMAGTSSTAGTRPLGRTLAVARVVW